MFKNITKSKGFNEFTVNLNSRILISNDDNLSSIIKLFFKKIIKPSSKYFIIIVFEYSNGGFKSIGPAKIVTLHSLDNCINYYLSLLNFKSSDYTDTIVSTVIFKWFKIPEDKAYKYQEKWEEIKPIVPIKLERFGKFELPLNMNYES